MPTIHISRSDIVSGLNDGCVSPSRSKVPRSFAFPFITVPEVEHCRSYYGKYFKETKCIGTGSSAIVHYAILDGDEVAIKLWKNKGKPAVDRAIEFEMSLVSRLQHPNIVNIVGISSSHSRFMVMEYLPGGTLDQFFKKRKQPRKGIQNIFKHSVPKLLSVSEILKYAIDIASAIKYLHSDFHEEAMIIHRDIKPQNIGFSRDGNLKLFDFGVSTCIRKKKDSDEPYEMTGNTGTPLYMAPEVALRKPYNEKVDVYSFGMILWQLVTGEVPFDGMCRQEFIEKVVKNGVRPAIPNRPEIPSDLIDLIQMCWNYESSLRPSISEVVVALNQMKAAYTRKSSIFALFFAPKSSKVFDESLISIEKPTVC